MGAANKCRYPAGARISHGVVVLELRAAIAMLQSSGGDTGEDKRPASTAAD
jgi:hypothetical protein